MKYVFVLLLSVFSVAVNAESFKGFDVNMTDVEMQVVAKENGGRATHRSKLNFREYTFATCKRRHSSGCYSFNDDSKFTLGGAKINEVFFGKGFLDYEDKTLLSFKTAEDYGSVLLDAFVAKFGIQDSIGYRRGDLVYIWKLDDQTIISLKLDIDYDEAFVRVVKESKVADSSDF